MWRFLTLFMLESKRSFRMAVCIAAVSCGFSEFIETLGSHIGSCPLASVSRISGYRWCRGGVPSLCTNQGTAWVSKHSLPKGTWAQAQGGIIQRALEHGLTTVQRGCLIGILGLFSLGGKKQCHPRTSRVTSEAARQLPWSKSLHEAAIASWTLEF